MKYDEYDENESLSECRSDGQDVDTDDYGADQSNIERIEQPLLKEEYSGGGDMSSGTKINNNTNSYSSYSYDYSPEGEKKKTKHNNAASVFVICAGIVAVLLLLSAFAGMANNINTGFLSPQTSEKTEQSTNAGQAEKTGVVIYNDKDEWINSGYLVSDDAIVNATYHVIDSVVAITTGNYVSQGAGSGVIIAEKQDSDGNAIKSYIITNNHVIDGASSIKVTLSNGDTHDARLIGTDPQTDIAVVTIDAVGLTKATFGDSSSLKLGQSVIAIGNPLGSLAGTVTSGIISSLERDITIDGVNMSLLQTSAAINPGNSGGGLFSLDGKLIGIVNAKSSGTNIEGLGFAIPADTAKLIAEDIISNGYVSGRCMIGINGTIVTADNYSSYQNSELYTDYIYKYYKAYGSLLTGFYVTDDTNVNYASDTGETFKYGDIIAEIGSIKVQDSTSITSALASFNVGDTVTVRVYRLVEEEVSSFFGGTRKQTTIKSFDVSVVLTEYKGE